MYGPVSWTCNTAVKHVLSFPTIYNHEIMFSTFAGLTKEKKYLSTKPGTSLELSCSE
jgi:hypothetical protein